MGFDRTSEFNELVPNVRNEAVSAPAVESESSVRRRFGELVGVILNTQNEDFGKQLSNELLLSSQSILTSIEEDGAVDSKDYNIRQNIESLEKDLEEGEDLFGEQLREHHKVIILYLKQRLGNRERSRIVSGGKRNLLASKPQAAKNKINTLESKVVMMTEEDLAKKYKLSDAQLQVLQESTQELLSQHTAFAKELGTVGDHLTEIAKLQQTLTEQLEWQAALGERLLDEADSTMGTVQKGNKILEKVSTDSTMRNLVVTVFLVLSLLLILFAMMN